MSIITLENGLKYEEISIGTGKEIKSDDHYKVVIHYIGWTEHGVQYSSSYNNGKPFVFHIGLGLVIKGWDKGMVGMKEGGIRKLYIPSSLAYGSMGAGVIIGPNTDLIAKIEYLRQYY